MKSFNLRTALEEFPPPGGGDWSHTAAELEAMDKRKANTGKILDQDAEDTAAASPIAGEIDGDTTTLSGMSKPGGDLIRDTEDVSLESAVKIDMKPVDLDDQVLLDQDRRAYEPVSTGGAEEMAIAEQNIAQEGWLGKQIERIGDFFTHREKEVDAAYTSIEANLKEIARMRNKIMSRQGNVDVNGDTVSLSEYAKWLAIDGKLMDDPGALVREVERLHSFIDWSVKNYTTSIDSMYKYVSDQVWKMGESNIDLALENSKKIISANVPQGVDRWLTVSDKTEWKGKSYEDRRMPFLLGQWGLVGLAQEANSPVPGEVLRVLRHKAGGTVKKGELKPITKDVMRKLLDTMEKIEHTFSSHKANGDVFSRYLDAMDEFAYRYRNFNSLSKTEQDKVSDIYLAGKIVINNDFGYYVLSYSNHVIKVLLLYIEKSLRRVEQ